MDPLLGMQVVVNGLGQSSGRRYPMEVSDGLGNVVGNLQDVVDIQCAIGLVRVVVHVFVNGAALGVGTKDGTATKAVDGHDPFGSHGFFVDECLILVTL